MTGVVFRSSICMKDLDTPMPPNPSLRASCTMFMRSKPLDTAMSAAIPWLCVPGSGLRASAGLVASLQPDVMRNGKPHISRNSSSLARNSGSMLSPPVPVWEQSNSRMWKCFICAPRSLSSRRYADRQVLAYPREQASSRSGPRVER